MRLEKSMTKKNKLLILVNIWRIFPAYIAYLKTSNRKKISMDIEHWNCVKNLKGVGFWSFSFYMMFYKEFRTIFLYRIADKKLLYILTKLLFPGERTLYIACPDIGGGLFIQHGFSTIIAAKSIGEGCWINQQVTIGYKGTDAPVIGNNVNIYAGAIVIGNVNVSDSVTVGAGAVVTKDIEAGQTVVGNPAIILRRKD